jgi:hypothetical protein
MTNIVVAAVISVNVVTNWGGELIHFQDPAVEKLFANGRWTNRFTQVKETTLYLETNATATVVFGGRTNVSTLDEGWENGSTPNFTEWETNFYRLRRDWNTNGHERPSAGDFELISNIWSVVPFQENR